MFLGSLPIVSNGLHSKVLIKEILVCLFSMTQLTPLSEVSHIRNFFDPCQRVI